MDPFAFLMWLYILQVTTLALISIALLVLYFVYRRNYLRTWFFYWLVLTFAFSTGLVELILDTSLPALFFLFILPVSSLLLFHSAFQFLDIKLKKSTRVIHVSFKALLFIVFVAMLASGFGLLATHGIVALFFFMTAYLFLSSKINSFRFFGGLLVVLGFVNLFFPLSLDRPAIMTLISLSSLIFGTVSVMGMFGLHFYVIHQEQSRIRNRLHHLSTHDYLTGLHNRYYCEQLYEHIIRREEFPISLIYLDVDDLKYMNDTKGHRYGDALLKRIASVITRAIGEAHICARVGGDEFIIILKRCDASEAYKIAAALNEKPAQGNVTEEPLSFSMGTATTQEKTDFDTLCQQAETEMYRIKHCKKSGTRKQLRPVTQ